MLTFNWPHFNNRPPQPQPIYQTQLSPETAQVILALQRGQRSQIMPMPAPPIQRKPG